MDAKLDKKKELIAYFERAKNLEVALHTNNNLQPAYLQRLEQKQPVEPVLKTTPSPIRPERPERPEKEKLNYFVACISVAMSILLTVAAVFIGSDLPLIPFFAFVFVILTGWAFVDIGKSKKTYKRKLAKYETARRLYFEQLEKDKKQNAEYQKQYQEEKEAFDTQLKDFSEKKQLLVKKFDAISVQLEGALEELYSKNVIFPKYRNLVAVTTILEYLSSGRCSELEGPDGAYNLYEMELRQNVVIAQLSAITSNLESIRNNQYTLYQEIRNSNGQIQSMLQQIGDELSIANYQAQMTNIALTSPKISYGVII